MDKFEYIILEGGSNPSLSSLQESLNHISTVSKVLTGHAVAVIENKQFYSEIKRLKFDLEV